MRFRYLALLIPLLIAGAVSAQKEEPLENKLADAFFDAKKIVFLGDSITYKGEFLVTLESYMISNDHNGPKMLNLGLQSETCSGDSEPAHPWPRPNVHERLQRLLDKVKPDLLVVNYGMNDGIYHPFDKKRFENYKAGINAIIEATENVDPEIRVILVTPPPFDPLPVQKKGALAKKDAKAFSWKAVYENYDAEVIAVYSKWILEQESRVTGCIDVRSPILEALAEKRKSKADFFFAHDGVHLNAEGHEVMGTAIAQALGLDTSKALSRKAKDLIGQRQSLLRDSWLTEVGHKRPNAKAGTPVEMAEKLADRLSDELDKMLEEEGQKETKSK